MLIKCVPLGAGQDVGKSCVIVTVGGKNIMFDCGMHQGYQDERRYPKFSYLSKRGSYTDALTCVIITHFHLDHIGALPYFTEVCGYNGPVYMTYPTKALAPLLLEDYRKVLVDKRGEQELFSVEQIQQCLKKVTAIDLKQTIRVDNDLEIRAYYAGHVLGAAMFYAKVGDDSVVYTGDYNMTPERHLGAAQIESLQPDLLITESTYATTIRDSKRAREREFLQKVHSCVTAGGKVLIPVSAVGRAQELCILLDEYWERMNLSTPIYFSAGLTMQANVYYKHLISWASPNVKDTFVTRNIFDFKHVSPFDHAQIDAPGPCVLFATPGMLNGGLSLEVFRHWAPSELNMVVIAGFWLAGTVGNKLLAGKTTKVEIDKRSPLDMKCKVHQLSFSAHTDAKGILDLVKHVNPRHVVLVHGEKPKMAILKDRIVSDLDIPCFDPANHETIEVPSRCAVQASMSKTFLNAHMKMDDTFVDHPTGRVIVESHRFPVEGVVMMDGSSKPKILDFTETPSALNVKKHDMTFSCELPIIIDFNAGELEAESRLRSADKVGQELPRGESLESGEHSSKATPVLRKREDFDLQMVPEEEDVVWKTLPVDAKRPRRLNLETEADIHFKEEAPSEIQQDRKKSSNASNFQTRSAVASASGISRMLDMNSVPDSSSEMELDSAGQEPLGPSPRATTPSSDAVLHALYVKLKDDLRKDLFTHEGELLCSRSVSLQVCENQGDEFKVEGLSSTSEAVPEPIVVVKCIWSHEDELLAHKILDYLRQCRLRIP